MTKRDELAHNYAKHFELQESDSDWTININAFQAGFDAAIALKDEEIAALSVGYIGSPITFKLQGERIKLVMQQLNVALNFIALNAGKEGSEKVEALILKLTKSTPMTAAISGDEKNE